MHVIAAPAVGEKIMSLMVHDFPEITVGEVPERIRTLLCCPSCHGKLQWETGEATCDGCARSYPIINGRPDFAGAAPPETEDAEFQQERMNNRSLRGRLYDLGQKIVTSEYAPFDHRMAFLSQIEPSAVVVEFGSGNRRISPDIVNIDLFMFPNVDVAADIERSPLRDACADYVILDSVVEHVPNPQRVIEEIHRVLKPGGKLFVVNPFLFQYHGYPAHYCNFTRDGMRHLLRAFAEVAVEPHYGPTSAMTNLVSEYVALAVAGERRTHYLVVRALMLVAIGWLRFFDKWLIRRPQSHRLSGMLCSIATK